jgi:outer membrane lipoprotein SlyB
MKKLITMLVMCLLIASCANMANITNNKQNGIQGNSLTNASTGVGAIGGAVGGALLDRALGTGNLFTGLGMLAGASITSSLSQHLTEQDQKNVVATLNDTKSSRTVAWCSDSANTTSGKKIKKLNCGNTNKIITTASKAVVDKNTKEVCRATKTEIIKPDGTAETVNQTLCLANGEWREKSA